MAIRPSGNSTNMPRPTTERCVADRHGSTSSSSVLERERQSLNLPDCSNIALAASHENMTLGPQLPRCHLCGCLQSMILLSTTSHLQNQLLNPLCLGH